MSMSRRKGISGMRQTSTTPAQALRVGFCSANNNACQSSAFWCLCLGQQAPEAMEACMAIHPVLRPSALVDLLVSVPWIGSS